VRIVTIPGIGGSGPSHWQTLWEREDASLTRFTPSSWDEPSLDDWSAALDRAVGAGPSLLVAHSLGCLLAAEWARSHPAKVAGLFLVAVPDPDGPRFPSAAASFRTIELAGPLGVPALVVASDDDPYCSTRRSRAIADAWGAERVSVGDAGHINAESGLGSWDAGRTLLRAFAAQVADRRATS
jgi:predicted alpha/beta hydrolase family esterase